MAIRFVPFTAAHVPATRQFNERLLSGHAATTFLMQVEAVPNEHSQPMAAVDEDEVIRGGYLDVRYPVHLPDGRIAEALNCQSPLSEGLVDPKYLMLPLQMFKYLQKQNPLVFVVGMGGVQNPLPRMLKAAGWGVEEVPFFYRICAARRFLTQMPLLRNPWWKRAGAWAAGWSGAGHLAVAVAHRRRTGAGAGPGWTLEPGSWDAAGIEDLGRELAGRVSFAAVRDSASLRRMYPAGRIIGPLLLKKDGLVRGWSTGLVTQMKEHRHFGNLRAGTILDCLAQPGAAGPLIDLTWRHLAAAGADLVITNQAWEEWQREFLAAGFRTGPSNYVFASSPKLCQAIGSAEPVASGRIHLTRGDGDGSINL